MIRGIRKDWNITERAMWRASGKTAEVKHAHVLIQQEKLDFYRQQLFPIFFGKSADGLFKKLLLLNLTAFNAE
jgi:hypothetical protein